jgi:aspartate beta-hydroxylase
VAYGEPTVTEVVKHLEDNYKAIKEEYMSAVLGIGTQTDMSSLKPKVNRPLEPDYDVNLRGGEHASDSLHKGIWDWHSYILNGEIKPKFAESCPNTASILKNMENHLFYSSSKEWHNPFGFTFFSTLHGKSFIKPHTGPMNLRLRIHLPLIVPSETKPDAYSVKPKTKCGIRVGDQIREWKEGKAVVLDDSYEHEVWNETEEMRVILLVDIWHPDVRQEERKRIGKMFKYAVDQGWMKSTTS